MKIGLPFIAIIILLGGCQTTQQHPTVKQSKITSQDLRDSYLAAIRCVHGTYEVQYFGQDKPPLNMDSALNICDYQIKNYARLISDKALLDNNWSHYTQPVYERTIAKTRIDIRNTLEKLYAEARS